MEFDEIIAKRKSIRSFKPTFIDELKLMRILDNAIRAPSAGNMQPWEFIIIRDAEMKHKLAEASLHQYFIVEAPVIIVVCYNIRRSASRYGRRGAEFYSIIDASLASQNIMLSAINEGLGSCFIGAFNDDRVVDLLKLPTGIRPLGIIPIGYPDEIPWPTSRYPLEKVVHFDKW